MNISTIVFVLSIAVILFAACAVAAHFRIDRLRRETTADIGTVVDGVNRLHDHICPCTTNDEEKSA